MMAQLVNGMMAQGSGATIGKVTAEQVSYVQSQLKAAGIQL